jgi:hypothetical protein
LLFTNQKKINKSIDSDISPGTGSGYETDSVVEEEHNSQAIDEYNVAAIESEEIEDDIYKSNSINVTNITHAENIEGLHGITWGDIEDVENTKEADKLPISDENDVEVTIKVEPREEMNTKDADEEHRIQAMDDKGLAVQSDSIRESEPPHEKTRDHKDMFHNKESSDLKLEPASDSAPNSVLNSESEVDNEQFIKRTNIEIRPQKDVTEEDKTELNRLLFTNQKKINKSIDSDISPGTGSGYETDSVVEVEHNSQAIDEYNVAAIESEGNLAVAPKANVGMPEATKSHKEFFAQLSDCDKYNYVCDISGENNLSENENENKNDSGDEGSAFSDSSDEDKHGIFSDIDDDTAFMNHIRYKKRGVSDSPDSNESDSEDDKHGIFSDVNDSNDSDNNVDIDDHWKEIADNRLK